MKLDEFGFPRPADFDEKPPRTRPEGAVTGRRVALLIAAILIAFGGALLVEFSPEIERKLAQAFNLKDRRADAQQQALAAAIQERRFGDAGDICGKILRRQPRNIRLQIVQAQLYYQAGDQKKALAVCNDLESKAPNDPRLLHMKASILAKMKSYREAIKACDKLLGIDPGDAGALNNRAYFRALARVDLKEALDDVEEALRQQPESETFIDTRAYLLYLFGRFDEALVEYNRILGDGGGRLAGLEDDGEIYFHRGLLYKHLGDDKRGNEDYDRARRLGFTIDEEPPPIVKKGVDRA